VKTSCRISFGDGLWVVKPTDTQRFVYDRQGWMVVEYRASASNVKAELVWALPFVVRGAQADLASTHC
jgi:hypothetical protein